jgi:hypothetical protein
VEGQVSKTIAPAWGRDGAALADYGSGGVVRSANAVTWARRGHLTYSVAGSRSTAIHWGQGGRQVTTTSTPLAQGAQTIGGVVRDRRADRLLLRSARPHAGQREIEVTMLAVNTEVTVEAYDASDDTLIDTLIIVVASTTTPTIVRGTVAIGTADVYCEAVAVRDTSGEPGVIYLLSIRETPLEVADL